MVKDNQYQEAIKIIEEELRNKEKELTLTKYELRKFKNWTPSEKARQAAEVIPFDIEDNYILAMKAIIEKRFIEAEELLIKNIELQNSLEAKNYIALGDAKFCQNEYSQALVWYRKALDEQPNNLKAIYNIGIVLLKLGDYNEAEMMFKVAIENRKDKYNYKGTSILMKMNYLATSYHKQNKLTKTESTLRKLLDIMDKHYDLEIKTKYYQFYINLAALYQQIGKYKEAELTLVNFIKMVKDNKNLLLQ